MGRFTSVDPIWVKIDRLVDPQRLNHYAYGRNNPLLFVDPDGRDVTIGRCSIGSTQDCFNQLQAGLTKQDREHVKLVTGDGKNGCDKGVSCVMVDADYKSDSKNFQTLQTLGTGGVQALTAKPTRNRLRRTLTPELEKKILDTTLKTRPPDATQWTVRTLAKHLRVSRMMVHRVWQRFDIVHRPSGW